MKTTLLLFTLTLITFSCSISAQTTNFAWQIGSPTDDNFTCVEVDDEGNIYLGGAFSAVGDMDADNSQSAPNGSVGSDAQFVLGKYAPDGSLLWEVHDESLFAPSFSRIHAIDVTADHVYAMGEFGAAGDDDVQFDTGQFFNSNGEEDIWVMQLDRATGAFITGRPIGGVGKEVPGNIRVDSQGDVWICGVMDESAGSPTIEISPGFFVPTPAAQKQTAFIVKMNPDLTASWVGSIGDTDQFNNGNFLPIDCSLEINSQDEVIWAGNFVNDIDLNPGPGTNLQSHTGRTMFLIKLDNNGGYITAGKFGDDDVSESEFGNDFVNDIAIDVSDNVIICGRIGHPVNFNFTGGENSLIATSGLDMFIANYDPDLNCEWVTAAAGSQNEECYGLDTDTNANIYVAGYFTGYINGAGTAVQAQGSNDSFWMCLSTAGTIAWIETLPSDQIDQANAIAVSDDFQDATLHVVGKVITDIVPSIYTSLPQYDNPANGGNDCYLISQSATIHSDPCAVEPCEGDLNSDGTISVADLLYLLTIMGTDCAGG